MPLPAARVALSAWQYLIVARIGPGIAGVGAAAFGAAAAQLVAALVAPSAAPVVAVAAVIVDLTPTPLKEWAVSTFGTADKVVLLVTVAAGVAVLAAVAGVLGARRPRVGIALFIGLGLVGMIAAASRPSSGALGWLPGAVGTVVGVLLLRWQLRLLAERRQARPDGEATGVDRRVLLTGAAGAIAATVAVSATGEQATTRVTPSVTLPPPDSAAPAFPTGVETTHAGVSPLRTPVPDFYRVDTALVVPQLSTAGWKLQISGMVSAPYEVTWDELLAMPLIERDITLTCVSNEIGGPYCGSTRWTGVPVADLLRRAGPDPAADQVLSSSVDGYTSSTPLALLLDGRDAMIAIAMDGQPLTQVHGFPARLLTPGVYGYVGATKWLTHLKVTTFAADEAYWTQRGWAEQAPVKTATRIDTPKGPVPAGQVVIGGVAWATHRGIGKVEVQIDSGPWTAAELGPDVGLDYWRQWYLPWTASAGQHQLAARAYDASGLPQESTVQGVLPDGATGYHIVQVNVG